MMTEIYDSRFHRWYVGGTGAIAEEPSVMELRNSAGRVTIEQILEEYRWYVGDPTAELPKEMMKIFLAVKRTENGGKT